MPHRAQAILHHLQAVHPLALVHRAVALRLVQARLRVVVEAQVAVLVVAVHQAVGK